MIEALRAGSGGSGFLNLLDQFFERGLVAEENELERIGHAEVDAVLGMQGARIGDAFAVYECTVAAAHVFEEVIAIGGDDLRLLAADAAVAQDKLIAGLATDAKRKLSGLNLAADSRGIEDKQSRRARHRLCGPLRESEKISERRASLALMLGEVATDGNRIASQSRGMNAGMLALPFSAEAAYRFAEAHGEVNYGLQALHGNGREAWAKL